MARLPRLYAPNAAHYLTQRAAPGRALFEAADDYPHFVELMRDAARAHGIAIHAYVLLPRSIEWLATPSGPGALAAALQAIGRRHVPYINRRSGASGGLWDGRYRSTLIDPEDYLLPVMRYIETRPVAERLVATPGEWMWSSHAHHAGIAQQSLVSDHLRYWALSDTPFERQAAYRALLDRPLDPAVAERIRASAERGWALGNEAFVETLEASGNRRARPLPRGRPRKASG